MGASMSEDLEEREFRLGNEDHDVVCVVFFKFYCL